MVQWLDRLSIPSTRTVIIMISSPIANAKKYNSDKTGAKEPILFPPSDKQKEDELWVKKNIAFCPTVKSGRTQSLSSFATSPSTPKRPSTSPAKEAPPARLPRTESPPYKPGKLSDETDENNDLDDEAEEVVINDSDAVISRQALKREMLPEGWKLKEC